MLIKAFISIAKSSKIPDESLTKPIPMPNSSKQPKTAPFSIGCWRAVPEKNQLVKLPEGKTEKIEPKVMNMLVYFHQHLGEVLSKERILEDMWPGLVVGEDTLARTISRLRKNLGDGSSFSCKSCSVPSYFCE